MMTSNKLQSRIEEWLARDYRMTFMERIEKVLESEELYKDEPPAHQYGHTLQHILSSITIVIEEQEVLVGSVKQRIPSEDEERDILATYKRWWDIPIEQRHKKVLFYYSEGWLKCRPYWFSSFGHLAMDWEAVIETGFCEMKRKAQKRLKEEANVDQKEFLEGAILCYDAIISYFERYAEVAKQLGKQALAEDLLQVSTGKAHTFLQALQQIWLLTLVLQKICGCGVLNFSCMDRYLRPLYEKDREEGRITEEEALHFIREFYFKNNEIMAQTDHMSQETESTAYTLEVAYDDPNYLILGGKRADGTSAVSELSYLMVKAAKALKLRNPYIVVRYHQGIDPTFWRLCCDAMRENTTLVLYNDETMIPALQRFQVKAPEVYDYGFYGCNDPNIPGYEGGLRQVWVNLAKPLELALHQGDYPLDPRKVGEQRACEFKMEDRMTGLMTGAYYGKRTKPPEEIQTMEQFLAIYEEQLTYLIGEYRNGFENDFLKEKVYTKGKIRIEDCFLKGTIEHGITWTKGGTKYHKIVTQGSGIATVINALYAVEQLVFVKKEMTMSELCILMKEDYKGSEVLAQKFKRKIEKFGNDIEAVDKYAKIVTDMFVRAIERYNGSDYLYQMWPTYSSDRDFTTMGKYVGATPDGRRAKEQLSENQSPAEGSDLSGVTAMLNSISSIPFDKITGGPLNLRLHPSAVSEEKGLDVMCALFKTYMEKGGLQLQVNVVDANTLKEAQKMPEKYKTLCVRVTGYSAFFVEMGEGAQEEMIRRTEQIV